MSKAEAKTWSCVCGILQHSQHRMQNHIQRSSTEEHMNQLCEDTIYVICITESQHN